MNSKTKNNISIIGSQWGDEGKGKIIDIFAEKADIVVRSQGGNNAGHTVVNGNETYKLHLIPSGILYPNKPCYVGAGVVIDPKSILQEIDGLTERGIDTSALKIDYRAHIVMPYHISLDGLSEKLRGDSNIGTTNRGIGPCYMDKYERSGIRFYDLIHPEIFASKARPLIEHKNDIITKIYGGTALNANEIISEYIAYGERLKQFAADISVLTFDSAKAGKQILFEGAQATLLDIDFGTYPYVTSSHPIAGGVCVGTGVGPTMVDEVIGVAKAYTTRVGEGPFPTELDDEIGEQIRTAGGEYGTTTGRPRRCGWFDAVIMKHSIRINGMTGIALNKLDTLTGIKTLKICTEYTTSKDFPPDIAELEKAKPIYTELDGWDEDISAVRKFEDLPKNAQVYVKTIEEVCGCPVKIVGVGAGREQIVYV
jgi:adenylosuccinate synthase